ncbi:hypothetical protein VTK26DRAFT_3082 [Humicola hyalothermophila]
MEESEPLLPRPALSGERARCRAIEGPGDSRIKTNPKRSLASASPISLLCSDWGAQNDLSSSASIHRGPGPGYFLTLTAAQRPILVL